MPRVRMLWPEHKAHRKVKALSDFQYRTWMGMISEADDDGRVIAEPGELRDKIFVGRPDLNVRSVKNAVRALARAALIRLYQAGGVHYAHFPSWRDWQNPRYPTTSKLPAPPAIPAESAAIATPLRRGRPRMTRQVTEPLRPGRGGEELNGVGRNGHRRRTVAHAIEPKPAPAIIADIDARVTGKLRAEEHHD